MNPLLEVALGVPVSPELLMERAAGVALQAHAGQVDKQGRPYILHVTQVMNSDRLRDLIDVTIAALHDVVEGTRNSPVLIISLEILRKLGFPPEVVDAVALLTREVWMSYPDYILHIIESGNVRAMRVKLADLDNHISHMPTLNTADRPRLAPRYIAARKHIELALAGLELV